MKKIIILYLWCFGITISFTAIFMMESLKDYPVALIKSNPEWNGWSQECLRFGMRMDVFDHRKMYNKRF